MKKYISPAFCLLTLIFLSCGNAKRTVRTTHQVMDTLTVSASSNPYEVYRATKPRYWDITHTRVALSFNMQEKTADGNAWIKMHPYFYATDSLVLDAKTMDIDTVLLTGNKGSLEYSQREDRLVLHFDKRYFSHDTIELFIRYRARPYAAPTGGSAAIKEDRGLYFINTDGKVPGKPAQIWTQGETEANSHWMPTLDQPNERFTLQIELTVPDSFATLSNGAMIASAKRGNGFRTDTWYIAQPIQPYAAMFTIGRFAIVEDKPWKGKKINYYVEPEFANYAKAMFNNTREMIDYYSGITGVPYPWNKYSQVVVRDYVSGAMENTSASLFGEFMNQNFREIADKNYEDVVSHELFHQWFGDYVTAESWSHLTLNESFANYGEQLWRKYKYGAASNDELAFNDLAGYLNATNFSDEQLVRFYYGDKEEMFDRISYQKGGAILRYLHGLMGDSAFYRAMNIYLTRNALQPAEAHHWRLAVEEASGLDWNWFFDQWYFRGGHPQLNVQYKDDPVNKQIKVLVNQSASDNRKSYHLPLKAALVYGDQKELIEWTVTGKLQIFNFPYRGGIRPIFIPDQEHWLVGLIREKKDLGQWLQQLRVSTDYINKRKAVSAAFMVQNDSLAQRIFHEALQDSLAGIRAYTLSMLERVPAKYKWHENFKHEVLTLAVTDPANRVRAAAFNVFTNWADTAETARLPLPKIVEALADSSYIVAGAALRVLRETHKDTAYFYARKILREAPRADLENAAWEIMAFAGKAADIALFQERAAYVYGSRKMNFAGSVYLYNQYTKDTIAFEKGLRILTVLAQNESIKSYRYGIGAMVLNTALHYWDQAGKHAGREKGNDAKRRAAIAEKYRKLILSNETDEENLKKYKSMEEGKEN